MWTTRHRSGGFTLIELLVVIGIIMVLSGLLLAALGGASDRPNRVMAGQMVSHTEVALTQFKMDYGQYPWSAPTPPMSDIVYELAPTNRNLTLHKAKVEFNVNHVGYLELPEKMIKAPDDFASSGNKTLVDPWGCQYLAAYDSRTRSVRIWSRGPDRKTSAVPSNAQVDAGFAGTGDPKDDQDDIASFDRTGP